MLEYEKKNFNPQSFKLSLAHMVRLEWSSQILVVQPALTITDMLYVERIQGLYAQLGCNTESIHEEQLFEFL